MIQKYIGLWGANGETVETYADIRRFMAEGKGAIYGLVNPGKLLWQVVGSLSQPIFARGQIKANYKTAQLTEENLKKKMERAESGKF